MKQRKTGYIALAAVGLVIIAVIAVMVMGNHFGEKQDDAFSTGVTTEKKEDLPAAPIEAEDGEGNTGQKAESMANEDDGTKKESPADKDNGTKKESTADKDDGKDTSDKKDKTGDDEKTDIPDKQNDSPADTDKNPSDRTDSDKQNNKETDHTEPQNPADTDDGQGNAIELPFVPAK